MSLPSSSHPERAEIPRARRRQKERREQRQQPEPGQHQAHDRARRKVGDRNDRGPTPVCRLSSRPQRTRPKRETAASRPRDFQDEPGQCAGNVSDSVKRIAAIGELRITEKEQKGPIIGSSLVPEHRGRAAGAPPGQPCTANLEDPRKRTDQEVSTHARIDPCTARSRLPAHEALRLALLDDRLRTHTSSTIAASQAANDSAGITVSITAAGSVEKWARQSHTSDWMQTLDRQAVAACGPPCPAAGSRPPSRSARRALPEHNSPPSRPHPVLNLGQNSHRKNRRQAGRRPAQRRTSPCRRHSRCRDESGGPSRPFWKPAHLQRNICPSKRRRDKVCRIHSFQPVQGGIGQIDNPVAGPPGSARRAGRPRRSRTHGCQALASISLP